MIVEETTIELNVTQCTTTVAMSGSMDSTTNVDVTTCFDADEEGIFDDSFDSTFE